LTSRAEGAISPILSMTALDAALYVWDGVDLDDLHGKSIALSQLFIDLAEEKCSRHGLKLLGSRDMERRGSHVSFHCPEGYAVMQPLIAQGVIGDFRMPDVIRFGITPLYTSFVDIWEAAAILARILDEKLCNKPEFLARKAVT
jgi:kynureninase